MIVPSEVLVVLSGKLTECDEEMNKAARLVLSDESLQDPELAGHLSCVATGISQMLAVLKVVVDEQPQPAEGTH